MRCLILKMGYTGVSLYSLITVSECYMHTLFSEMGLRGRGRGLAPWYGADNSETRERKWSESSLKDRLKYLVAMACLVLTWRLLSHVICIEIK